MLVRLLRRESIKVGQARRTLMKRMGIEALYRKPNTSASMQPTGSAVPVAPPEDRPVESVWALDTTISDGAGFVYLTP